MKELRTDQAQESRSRPGEHRTAQMAQTDKERQQKKRMEQAFAGAQGAPPPIAQAFAAAAQGKTADDADPLLTAPARRAKLAEDLKNERQRALFTWRRRRRR